MHRLPENLHATDSCVFRISAPLLQYLSFVETQLGHQVNDALEQSMFATFALLLAEQRLLPQVDRRIRQVLQVIDMRLSERLTLDELAQTACLSETQLKKLFRQQIGLSVMQYLTRVRMEKAKALLQHTDYSVQRIAEQVVGFQSPLFCQLWAVPDPLQPLKSGCLAYRSG
jgi:transcriptional regulator GlxA family with amidase domain